jgi:hypothetical protein
MAFFTDRERNALKKLPEAGGGVRGFVPPQQDRRVESARSAPKLEAAANSQDEIRAASEPADPGFLLQSAARAQVREIDVLITDLQTMREKLCSEAARVQRVVVEYAAFSETASQSSKVICDSLRNGLRPFQHKRHKEKARSRARRKARRRLARLSMSVATPEAAKGKQVPQSD